MEKLLECIFAYICKNNYMGECMPADQIYTVTKNASEKELSIVSEAIQNIGRAELAKIDAKNGVSLYPEKIEPNFNWASYTYLPSKGKGYSAFSCATLRKSLKNKSIRGSKELSHVLVFDNIEEDFYIVDLLKHKYFSGFDDIRLDESAAIASSNEDLVCEIKPNELETIGWENFHSRPLSSSDVLGLGKKAFRVLSEYVHAILVSAKENKTLYVVYTPEEYDQFLYYTKAVLKLFPASVANKISFVTALGKTSRVNVDICGVPTCDEEYISTLKKEGNVIKITGLDVDYLDGDKGSFASFLETANEGSFEDWLESLERYQDSIQSITDIDIVSALYTNIIGKDFDVENPRQSLIDVSSCIKVVTDKFDVISKIDNELESQIEGIGTQIKHACGAFAEYSTYEIEEFLIEPILALYAKCSLKAKNDSKDVLSWLKYVLFGLPGQAKDLERKHYEVFSVCHKKVKQLLAGEYVNFVNMIENEWNTLKSFFDNYLNEPNFSEVSAEISLSFLNYFLSDFSNTRRSRVIIRDYFVLQFLQKNPEKFEEIVKIIFSKVSDRLQDELSYVFDTVIKINSENRELLESRIEFFCVFVRDSGLLNQVLEYVRNRYTKQFSEDEILNRVFKGLLSYSLAVPQNATLNDIHNSFKQVEKLLGDSASTSLRRFVFECFANDVLIPKYESALRNVRFEDMNDADEERYRYFTSQLKSTTIKGLIPKDVIDDIDGMLYQFVVFKTQMGVENKLLAGRIDFVARELSLLENKTIYKILLKYIGEEKMTSDLQVANIEGKPFKHKDFLKFADKEVREYLNDRGAKNKLAFCEEVREERKRVFRDVGVVVVDALRHFIGSAIFAAFMGVVAALLGWLVFTYVANQYFRNIYIIFTGIIALFSLVLYWTNYRDRRLRNVVIMSTWQAILVIIGTLGIFTLTQYLMVLLAL